MKKILTTLFISLSLFCVAQKDSINIEWDIKRRVVGGCGNDYDDFGRSSINVYAVACITTRIDHYSKKFSSKKEALSFLDRLEEAKNKDINDFIIRESIINIKVTPEFLTEE